MKISNEIRVVGGVLGMLLILLAFLLYQNTEQLRFNNELEEQDIQIELGDQRDMMRAAYDRIVLGCNTAGALESESEFLRELCDETLPDLREEIYGVGR